MIRLKTNKKYNALNAHLYKNVISISPGGDGVCSPLTRERNEYSMKVWVNDAIFSKYL